MEGKEKTTLDIGLEQFFKIVSKKCKRGVTRKIHRWAYEKEEYMDFEFVSMFEGENGFLVELVV